jgi:hypothetical protein
MPSYTKTVRTNLTPRSRAKQPAAYPPHPPLQSGGWYHGTAFEALGPGRVATPEPPRKSSGLAVLLSVLFGPLGLFYLSTTAGLVATVVTGGALVAMGALSLLFLWPLAIVTTICSVRLRIDF